MKANGVGPAELIKPGWLGTKEEAPEPFNDRMSVDPVWSRRYQITALGLEL